MIDEKANQLQTPNDEFDSELEKSVLQINNWDHNRDDHSKESLVSIFFYNEHKFPQAKGQATMYYLTVGLTPSIGVNSLLTVQL